MNKDKKFVIIFLIFIYSILLLYPINYILIKKGILVNSYASYYTNEKLQGNILNKVNTKLNNYKGYLNVMITNYFPFYGDINYYTRKTLNFLAEKEYQLFGQNEIPLGKNSDDEYVIKNFKDKFFYLIYDKSDKEIDERLNKQISVIKKIASYNVPVSIYLPHRYEFTNNENINFRSYDKYLTKFTSSLNNIVKIKSLSLSKEDYLKSYYKTDHHWNAYAAKKALQDISKLLNVSLNDYEVKKVDNIKMYGSMAKSSGDTSYYDHLLYLDTPYDLKISNLNYKPLSITLKKDLFYDYYVAFFDGLTDEILSYDYGNGEENLLIIGDSFVWQLDYIIAEGFNKTYTICARYLENFNYENFIKENNISQVLILMESTSTMFDIHNYNLNERLGL